MKINSIKQSHSFIFQLWNENRLTIRDIANIDIPRFIAIKTVKNIVYGGPAKINTDFQREIYRIFRLKFLEVKCVKTAISFAYEHQPYRTYSEKQIRQIINQELRNRPVVPQNTQKKSI